MITLFVFNVDRCLLVRSSNSITTVRSSSLINQNFPSGKFFKLFIPSGEPIYFIQRTTPGKVELSIETILIRAMFVLYMDNKGYSPCHPVESPRFIIRIPLGQLLFVLFIYNSSSCDFRPIGISYQTITKIERLFVLLQTKQSIIANHLS